MEDLNKKLTVESWDQWFILKVLEKTEITDAELVNILNDKDITRIQELQLAKKREQYANFKPIWFDEFAPRSAEIYREDLVKSDNVSLMQHLQSILSYTSKFTINILPLNITFCNDVSHRGNARQYQSAKDLCDKKWYQLMSHDPKDHNNSDRYKIAKAFDYTGLLNIQDLMNIFKTMTGFHSTWLTSNYILNREWEILHLGETASTFFSWIKYIK